MWSALRALAELLPAVHATALPAVVSLPDYQPYPLKLRRPPRWASQPEVRVSGLVDWVNASVGSPWADIGHCRVNIASELGQQAADRLLELYRVISGRNDEYHPYWDISAAIGGLDQDVDEAPSPEDENFLVEAVARL